MSEIGSQSGANRPSLSDGTGRVSPTERTHGQSQRPVEGGQTGSSHTPSQDTLSSHGHHDPAVSLSASLARVSPGARIAGSVVEIDPEDRVVLRTAQGTFLLDFEGEIPPSVRQADRLVLQVIQTDHSIEARIVEANGRTLSAPPDVRMTLVKVPQPATTPPLSPDSQTPNASGPYLSYRPSPDAMTQASIRTDGREMLPLTVRLSPDGLAPAPRAMDTGLANTAVQPLAQSPDKALPRPGMLSFVPLPDQGGAAKPGAAPLPESSLSRAAAGTLEAAQMKGHPSVAAGLSFVARWQSPSAPALAPEPRSVALKTGQIVHVSVTPALPGGKTDPAIPATPPLTPPATPGVNAPLQTSGVVQTDPAGLRQIQTPLGTVPLPNENTIPNGTRVSLTVEPLTSASPATPPRATPDQPRIQSSSPAPSSAPQPVAPGVNTLAAPIIPLADYEESWPALSALTSASLAAAGTTSTTSAGNVLAGKLPTANNPITSLTLLFLNVAGIKSPAQILLGQQGVEAAEKQGHGAQLRAIEEDMTRLRSLTVDHAGLEWRPFMLPVQADNGVQALFMLVRHAFEQDDRGDGRTSDADDKDPKKVTRFILDLSLSNLGPLQVDGMIKTRRFDLILRSGEPLGERATSHIEGLFRAALDRNGFTGDCSFQSGRAFPVNVGNAIREAEMHRPPVNA